MALKNLAIENLEAVKEVGKIEACISCPRGVVLEMPLTCETYSYQIYCPLQTCPNRKPTCVIFDPVYGQYWPKE